MRAKRSIGALAGIAALLFSGCVSFDRETRAAVDALASGDDATALSWGDRLADESYYSKSLGMVEAGRINLLAGRYGEACRRFRAAVDTAVERSETAPRLKIGDLLNTAMAATVTDDRARQYYLPPYELNMALEYEILAEAFAGRINDVAPDARLAIYVQETLSETYGADLAKSVKEDKSSLAKIPEEDSAAMEAMIAASRNSWENPVLWWLTGLVLETEGMVEEAKQSYARAAAIRPENAFFAADLARTERGQTLAAGKAKLVVLYDQGFVPMREALKVLVPIYTGMSVDIPYYSSTAFADNRVTVAGASGAVNATPAVNIRSLAARDLKEQLPGIITRNITRASVQVGAQAAVNACGSEYAKLAVFLVNWIVSYIRRADTRSWATLPAAQQVWCDAGMEPGVYDIAVSMNGRTVAARVPLSAGETRVLWLADTGYVVRGASAPLGRCGVPPTDLNGKEIRKQ